MQQLRIIVLVLALFRSSYANISFDGLEDISLPEESSIGIQVGTSSALMKVLLELEVLRQGFLLAGIEVSGANSSVTSSLTTSMDMDALGQNVQELRQKFDEVTGSLYTGGLKGAEEILVRAIVTSLKKRGDRQLVKGSLACEKVGTGVMQLVFGDYTCSYETVDDSGQKESARVLMCINHDGDVVCYESITDGEEVTSRPGYEGVSAGMQSYSSFEDMVLEYEALKRAFDSKFSERYLGGKTLAGRIFYTEHSRNMRRKGNEIDEQSVSCNLLDGVERPKIEGKYLCEYKYKDEDDQSHDAKSHVLIDMRARVTLLK
ncbi:MAG: hypothetical protein H3C47_10780 [Candidatus Cloacimonetes bacterium]|nr:hypothetical protein [Candidatus Cloacimonadota bacterium]